MLFNHDGDQVFGIFDCFTNKEKGIGEVHTIVLTYKWNMKEQNVPLQIILHPKGIFLMKYSFSSKLH